MSEIVFTVDDRDYRWGGGYGAIIYSKERGVRPGDTRVILNTLFHCFQSYQHIMCWPWEKPNVAWTMRDVSNEKIAAFRQKALGA